ncbi:F-box/RNI-like superfamily protein [Striga asiatica]|uniref:F-box/RNI-like superfamily protein n=1 Tax=Striga asiatica TaxID=4170 RepID=A0A5A7R686_STRAF|nr:F-box/RNI-like superfamily protein [Striga asiatica]
MATRRFGCARSAPPQSRPRDENKVSERMKSRVNATQGRRNRLALSRAENLKVSPENKLSKLKVSRYIFDCKKVGDKGLSSVANGSRNLRSIRAAICRLLTYARTRLDMAESCNSWLSTLKQLDCFRIGDELINATANTAIISRR